MGVLMVVLVEDGGGMLLTGVAAGIGVPSGVWLWRSEQESFRDVLGSH